mgnify:CR=1 FL=1
MAMSLFEKSGLQYKPNAAHKSLVFVNPRCHYYLCSHKIRDLTRGEIVRKSPAAFIRWAQECQGIARGNVNIVPVYGDEKFYFGKHSGDRVSEVPEDYLRWIIDNFEKDSKWIMIAKQELNRRQAVTYA